MNDAARCPTSSPLSRVSRWLIALSLTAAACDQKGTTSGTAASNPAPTATLSAAPKLAGAPSARAAASSTASATAPAPSASAPSAADAGSAASAASARPNTRMMVQGWQLPTEPSKVPTVAEWNKAEDHDVRNAKALGCEAKFVREWVRVSCRTGAGAASPVKGVKLLKPAQKPADFYDFVKEQPDSSVASFVFPVRKAIDARIEFQWSTFSRVLTVAWAAGAPSPVVYFQGNVPETAGKKRCSVVCPIGPQFSLDTGCVPPGTGSCPIGYACIAGTVCDCKASADCVDDL